MMVDSDSNASSLQSEDLSSLSECSYNFKTEEQLKEEQEQLWQKQLKAKREREKEYREKKKQIQLKEQEKQREKALKGMHFLLSKSQLYTKFLGDKLESHFKKIGEPDSNREISKDCILNENNKTPVKDDVEIPKYFTGGTLRPYQLEGLVWLKLLSENGINGILADEMGLGKTIQVIALIAYLYEKNVNGPYLIVAPLSVTTNWRAEFKKFAPELPVFFFHGDKDSRPNLKYQFKTSEFKFRGKSVKPIIITSYQIAVMEKIFLREFKYSYVILDEAQFIKNSFSERYIAIDGLRNDNRLLLTGTPLQNNLIELWTLLHFLMPKIFGKSSDSFTSVLNIEDFKNVDTAAGDEKINNIISTIQGVLTPFMLRRLKQDVLTDLVPKKELIVYCPLSDIQRTLTKYVIERNLNLLSGKNEELIDVNAPRKKRKCTFTGNYSNMDKIPESEQDFLDLLHKEIEDKEENKKLLLKLAKDNKQTFEDGVQFIRSISMCMPAMLLREIANHPYLVHMPIIENEEGKPQIKISEDLINTSGKLRMLDLLLPRLKAEDHKVLIYSGFVMMLDIIEEYLIYRKYKYARLDGGCQLWHRDKEIHKFCNEKEVFVFIITTRAGGVGLNLVEADTVIFMDIDFNPQSDNQAQDRCHRIGQTKPVVVYKFISLGTIDEHILRIGEMKKRLERAVITNGRLNESTFKSEKRLDKDELLKLLKSVEAATEFRSSSIQTSILSQKELDELLDRSDLCKQLT